MTGSTESTRWTEFGLVRTGVAFTMLAGAVAVVLPFLNALVVALAAISLAGAVRPGATGRAATAHRVRILRWFAGASVVAGAVVFVALPAPWSDGRGLALGAALLPLLAAISPVSRSLSTGRTL
jgi:hypothetical protein